MNSRLVLLTVSLFLVYNSYLMIKFIYFQMKISILHYLNQINFHNQNFSPLKNNDTKFKKLIHLTELQDRSPWKKSKYKKKPS